MRHLLLATTGLVSAITLSSPAFAQNETVPDGAEQGLREIVVTAQHRSESSQRAAVALDVVSASELQNAGIVSSSSLNAAVPSLYVSKGGGVATSYFIRGVGNFTNNGYTDPAVAFNVDGVYYGRPGSTIGAFFDLNRIEVLKGPQGTLYGRNATGGAINIITAKPVPGELSGRASLGYGNYNAVDAEAAINLPLGQDGAFRISGKLIDRDGYNDDGTSDEKGHAIRAQLLGNLTDTLTVRVIGDYSHVGGMGIGGTYTHNINTTSGSAATATSPANYTIVATGLDPRSGLLSPSNAALFSQRVLGGPRINPGPLLAPFLNNNYYGASAEVTWKTGIGTLTVLPAYRNAEVRSNFNGPAFRGGLVHEDSEQFTLEARLAGDRVGPIDWLIGGFYFDENIKGSQNYSQYTVNSFQIFTANNTSSAIYGRLSFNVTNQLRLVGGLRYTKDQKTFVGDGRNLIQICASPTGCIGGPSVPVALTYQDLGQLITLPTLPGPANGVAFGTAGNRLFYTPVPVNRSLDRSRTTWRAAIEYDVAPQSLLYASYETGFRSGGFNFSLGHESYDPEYIRAWTIGMKNRFFDNRLQLNIEAFHWDYTNQQVAHFGLDSTGGNSYFTENIGKSRIQGIDVDIQFKATPNTLLRGSVQVLDNKLSSFVYNTQRNTTNNALPPPVGCSVTPGTAPLPNSTTGATGTVWAVDCSGNVGFNSPKLAFNAGIEQTIPLGDYELVATVDGRYRSNRVISFEYLSVQNSGADFTADASLRFGPREGKWSLTAYMQNIGNRLVPTLVNFAGTTGNVVVTNYAAPRTYGIKGSVSF
jgi:iron complex outermembrane receptor protein